MKIFKKIDLVNVETQIQSKIHGKIKFLPNPGQTVFQVTYTDYLFSMLKKDLSVITAVLKEHKIKEATVHLELNTDTLTYRLNCDSSDSLVELYETVKSVLPSAKNIRVENAKVEYGIQDLDLVLQSGAKVANVLANFFADDYTDMKVVVRIPGNIAVEYKFEWLNSSIIGETFSNSARYYEMIEFVYQTPHPLVETFTFKFKDSTKGIYAELGIKYSLDQPKVKTLQENEWIRSKLNQTYTHLPVF